MNSKLLQTCLILVLSACTENDQYPIDDDTYIEYKLNEIQEIIDSETNVAWPKEKERIKIKLTGDVILYKKNQILIINERDFEDIAGSNLKTGCLQLLIRDELLDKLLIGKKHKLTVFGEILKIYGKFSDPLALTYVVEKVDVYPTCAEKNNIFLYVHTAHPPDI